MRDSTRTVCKNSAIYLCAEKSLVVPISVLTCGNTDTSLFNIRRIRRSKCVCLNLSIVLSLHCVAFPMCIAANCGSSFVYCVIILCLFLLPYEYCFTTSVLLSYFSCRIAG
jgi:hypothetical protein